MTQQLSTHILSISKEAQQVKFALEKTLHPSRGNILPVGARAVWCGWAGFMVARRPLIDVDPLKTQRL